MKYLSNILLILVSCFLLSSCESTLKLRTVDSDFVAKSAGFTKHLVRGGDFWITTYQKITNKHLPYVFYIESDGKPFTYVGRQLIISADPTPENPTFLKLATLDKRPNVVYIARPCQFTPPHLNPKCADCAYWTNLRMSDEVVGSINDAINFINQTSHFSLVGYSGGGGIAVMVAARNKLAKDILTLSANLDTYSFKQYHNTVPMIGSLNPIDYAQQIKHIPQLHISGGKDKIVPPFIADKYVKASDSICVHQHIFDTATHSKGWEGVWRYILSIPLVCEKY